MSNSDEKLRELLQTTSIDVEKLKRELRDEIDNIDAPVDSHLVDAVNYLKFSNERNKDVHETGKPVQDKIVNLAELKKMIDAICTHLEIQLIEDVSIDEEKKVINTEYRAIKKGSYYEASNNRQDDLIFEEDDDGS